MENILVAFFNNLPAMISAVGVIITIWISWHNKQKLSEVALNVDGKMEKLLEVTAKASKAEGVKEEKENPTGAVNPVG